MFDRLGLLVSRNWVFVLLGWVVLALGIHWLAPAWDDVTRDGDFAYLPGYAKSVQGERLLEAAFPEMRSKSSVVLVVSRAGGALKPEDYAVADRLAAEFSRRMEQDRGGPVVGVLSHRTEVVGEKLVSRQETQGQGLLVVVQLRDELMAMANMRLMEEIYAIVQSVRSSEDYPAGLRLGVSGSAAIGADMRIATMESIDSTEWATILLVVGILTLVYRAPGLVVVPLVTIAASVFTATGLVAVLAELSNHTRWIDYQIFKTTRIFVIVVLFGAGVDFCLFLIARYREELESGLVAADAISRALGRVGNALVGSAVTTIVGLGLMVFADFGKFSNSGPTVAMCLAVALVACLTLAPAILRAIGPAVFWPFGVAGQGHRRRIHGEEPSGDGQAVPAQSSAPFQWFWTVLSGQVLARPGMVFVVTVLLLAPIGAGGLSVPVTYDLLSELPKESPSVRGTRLLSHHFAPGETSPITVLASREAGGLSEGEDRRARMQQLVDMLYGLEYRQQDGNVVRPITGVRSWVEPLGRRETVGLLGVMRQGIIRAQEETKSTYLAQAPEYADKVTRFDLVFRYDPFSLESIHLLDHLENHLEAVAADPGSVWYGTRFYFLGTTAGIRDLRTVTAADQVRIQQLVPLGVLAVLVGILRRFWIPVYLILTVLLGYFFTMGTTLLVFSSLYGDSFHGVDWKVPVFLFVILIAVGQDYNIYLTTRVFQEQKRHGRDEGLRVAMIRTGGIITSCGLIMAGTFAAMLTGSLRAVRELGFALALGILIDTFVIRTVLVPSFLVLWGRFREKRGRGAVPARPRTDWGESERGADGRKSGGHQEGIEREAIRAQSSQDESN